jgi:UDP-N-acetylmuramate--alanine ligase
MTEAADDSTALSQARRVHLVGVGGSGMASLAELLAFRGRRVSGSDLARGAERRLATAGVEYFFGHRAEQVGPAEAVIVSAAIPGDNLELAEARRRGLPVFTHAQALGALMAERTGVAVAGTHGKTTTTALVGYLLARAGLDPTVLVGAAAADFGGGARLGRGPHLVVEADEYADRFLALRPKLALITGIEADHLDYFADLEAIRRAFQAFAARVDPDGLILTCADDPVLAATALAGRRLSYGSSQQADWRLLEFRPRPGGGSDITLAGPGPRLEARLALTGRHNALNAVGAVGAVCQLGVDPIAAAAALAEFGGTERRFQTAWRRDGIWLVDDYAHHPTAVRATLRAAREVHAGRLWAVFQPHTADRLAALLDDFATCFEPADRLLLLPIYQPPGRTQGGRAGRLEDLAARIEWPPVEVARSLPAAAARLAGLLRPGDLVVVMGAGDVTELTAALVARLGAACRPA